ncbi:MAG TPA: hypothetical protein VFZ93_07620 [Albitalea sp.]
MTIKRMTREDLPQSLGAFKPVGHVLMAFRTEEQARDASHALREAGFEEEDILRFSCEEMSARLEHMQQHASDFAGFGYEVVLMRRYRELCREGGCTWVLVYAPENDEGERVAEVARRFEALTAVKYHRLVEEDLV